MAESKEKFSIKPQEKAPIEPKYTPEDYEVVGRGLLKVDPDLAQAYLRASHLSKTEINSLVAEAKKNTIVKEKKKMDPEEKKKMFEKMAEDFEEKAEKTDKKKDKDMYKDLAKTYRKELEEMSREIKNP